MRRPLAPSEFYPAHATDVVPRFLALATGVTVRLAECGPEDGRTVILLHGWGASLYMWRHAFQLLPAYGLRVVGVDLRGHGLSDKPRGRGAYTVDAYCADLDALYDALHLPSAALIGHSMGGAVALRYAVRHGRCSAHRVRRLGLINPAGLVPLAHPMLLRLTPAALTRRVHGQFVPRSLIALILRRLAYSDASLVTAHDIDEYWAPTRLPGFVGAATAGLREFDWRPLAASEASLLDVPTLVVVGREDRLFQNVGTGAARLRAAEVHELSGGHSVHEERPQEVYSILGDFLR